MDPQVIVALVSAVASIAVALIASRKEAKRAPVASSHSEKARPLLIFAATGAFLLSLTALGLTFYLQSLPRLGYSSVSVIIYAGSPAPAAWGGGPGYAAAKDPWVPPNEHLVSVEIPAGSKIIGAWYTLEDRIDQLNQFASINVDPIDSTHVRLKLCAQPGATSFMRIRLHAVYSR